MDGWRLKPVGGKDESMQIESEILTILSSSVVIGNAIQLPGQLDRKTYVKTDKVLTALGGKWDKKTKGHVFPFDPSDALDGALMTGTFINRKQQYQSFYTPREVAEALVRRSKLDVGGLCILEPSVGTGQLAEVIREHMQDSHTLLGIDIDPVALNTARAAGFDVIESDFLTYSDFGYDRIIANPPFTRGTDINHVMHMYESLLPGGRVVSVMSERVVWATDRKTEVFREFVESVDGEIHGLPEGSFKESGTEIKTVYVVLDRAA